MAQLSLHPTIFIVAPPPATRTIWRRARPVPSDTPGDLIWSFQEESDTWDDNFSTTLAVESVQAIGNWTFLKFDKLIILDQAQGKCDPDSADATRVSKERCAPINNALLGAGILTPASNQPTQGQGSLEWRLYFKAEDNPTLDGKREISVGFTLRSLMQGGSRLTAALGDSPVVVPYLYDFGPIYLPLPASGEGLGPSVTEVRAMRLSAEGSNEDWTVRATQFDGNDPSYFSAQFRDQSGVALTVPFTLGAGQTIYADLTFDPTGGSSPGLPFEEKQAGLSMSLQSRRGVIQNTGVLLFAHPQLPPGYDPRHPCPPHICRRPQVPPNPPPGPR
jgi:hypothetical protein